MSEITNQTVEITMRYYIASLQHIRDWPGVLGRMSASLNNSTKYSSTLKTPIEILYGFRTREALDLLHLEENIAQEQANIDPAHDHNITAPQAGNPLNPDQAGNKLLNTQHPVPGQTDAVNPVNAHDDTPQPEERGE